MLKVEDRIKGYYMDLRNLDNMNNRLMNTRKRIIEVKEALKGTKIKFGDDLGCQQYSDDIVGKGGKPSSRVEKQIETAYSRAERYLEKLYNDEDYIQESIIEIEYRINEMEYALDKLTDDEIKLIELRYKENNKVNSIAYSLFGGAERTAYRAINKVTKKIEMSVKCQGMAVS